MVGSAEELKQKDTVITNICIGNTVFERPQSRSVEKEVNLTFVHDSEK